jgi:regulator of sigma E protease
MDNVLGWLVPRLRDALPGALLLGIVIFVHELGHFLAAKARGVRVLRFSLGFGPRLVGFTRGGTEYQLSWIPLGGYVQMAGDSPAEDGTMPHSREEFLSHPWPGRVLIAVAGPLANLITAFIVMVVVGATGVSSPDRPSTLGATPDTSVAYGIGLRAGDRIVEINGKKVKTFDEIEVQNTALDQKHVVPFAFERGGVRHVVDVDAAQIRPLLASLNPVDVPPIVGSVLAGMPAYKAGVKEGDRILAVDGHPVSTWNDMRIHISPHADRPVTLRVARGNQAFDLTVTPVNSTGETGGAGQIGIEQVTSLKHVDHFSFVQSVELGFFATGSLVASVYHGMWLTVTRPLYYREYLGGPLFIAQAASQQAKRGVDSFLQFLALINVGIMAFNLMPLPVLDGGHIVLALLQAVRGQAISSRTYLNFQKVGLVLLGTLFVLILSNDPWRLIQRHRALNRAHGTEATHSAPGEKTVAPSPP